MCPRESQAGPGSSSTILLHDNTSQRGPGHLRPQAFAHSLQLWKPQVVVSCHKAHVEDPPPLFQLHLFLTQPRV